MSNPIAEPFVENAISPDLDKLVTIDADGRGAVTVTLTQPGAAIDGEVAAALKEAFETLHAADHVRVVFLRGGGGAFFSGPLTDWARIAVSDWSEADLRGDAMMVAKMLHALTAIPALTVALVEGEAAGVGAGLVAACDMALATTDARFSFPEVKGGAVAAMVAPYLVNVIGPRQAKGLLMTGRTFGVTEALRIGLLQGVAEPGRLDDAADDLVREVQQNAPQAMHEAKSLVWDVWGRPLDHALMDDTAHRFAKTRFSEEGREGLTAMVEGRRPSWAID